MSSLRAGEYLGKTCRQIEAQGTIATELCHRHKLSLPFHTHQSAYFSMLLSGGYEEWFLGRTRPYLLNELVFHPDDFGHHDRVTASNTFLLCLTISSTIQEQMRTRALRDRSPLILRGRAVVIALGVRELLDRSVPQDALALEELTLELLAAMNQWNSPAESRQPAWLRRSLEILHANLLGPISLQSLASEAQIHPLHFSRTFRRFHGCSLPAYVQRLRVEFARTQIRFSDRPLSQVAAMSGFADQSHMNRLFKRWLGLTPGALRASLSH